MKLEDRIERLEKIMIALQPCLPQARYAREYGYGLEPKDIMIAKDLISDIKNELKGEQK